MYVRPGSPAPMHTVLELPLIAAQLLSDGLHRGSLAPRTTECVAKRLFSHFRTFRQIWPRNSRGNARARPSASIHLDHNAPSAVTSVIACASLLIRRRRLRNGVQVLSLHSPLLRPCVPKVRGDLLPAFRYLPAREAERLNFCSPFRGNVWNH